MKSTSFAPDQQIGRYTIRKLLAQGGMAEVYKADQELSAGIVRPVALKVIRPEYSSSPDFREMFLDEARCACGLSHPNIVQIFDVGEADGLLYMAMELVGGETLATVNRTLREHKDKFTDEALYAIGIYCASALEAVHALKLHDSHVNLVHRDVSPHNLLLSSRGSLKLIDFGIAKAATNRNLTSPGVTKGKAGYFSPEQAMGKPLDGRSDLFSLGVTIYKLAFGATPFDHHQSHAERNGALVRGLWKPLDEVQPGLSRGLYEVVRKSMQLKPADRYATAAEMREALEQAAFADGFRIGSKSLLGYVTDDGAITAVPTGSRGQLQVPVPIGQQETRIAETRVAPDAPGPEVSQPTVNERLQERLVEKVPSKPKTIPLTPAGPFRRDERERVTDKVHERPRKKQRPAVMVGAFVGAVLVGGGVVLALAMSGGGGGGGGGGGEEVVAPVAARPSAQKETSAPLPPHPDPLPSEGRGGAGEVVEADPEPVIDETPAPPTPAKPQPQHATKPPKHARRDPPASKPERTEQQRTESAIPPGQGQLRISTQPASVASRVTVDRSDWGPAPVNQRIASGRYVVTVVLPGGKKSPEWVGTVMPDMTTVLIYDIDSGKWQRR